jgi:transposase
MVALSHELWFNFRLMHKAKAIELLGGTIAAAAKEVGVSYQAVDKWPEVLPPRISDRVLAAVARKHLPAALIGEEAASLPEESATGSGGAPSHIDTGERRRATDRLSTDAEVRRVA